MPAGGLDVADGDATLVARLRDGDERAFEAAVDSLSPAMLAVARGYVRTRNVAEEVVQDAWLGVIKGLEGFEARSTLRTWVLQIVANIARKRAVGEARSLPFSSLELGDESRRSSRSDSVAPTSRIPAGGGRSQPTGGRCHRRGCSHARHSISSIVRSPSCRRHSES